MTIEDFAIQFEGLDPAVVHRALADAEHLLGIIQAEMPCIKQLLADVRSQIVAYEAKQKQLNQWRT